VFQLAIDFPIEYPFKGPKIHFITPIYHPNVDNDGNLCVGVLKAEAWKPSTKAATSELKIRNMKTKDDKWKRVKDRLMTLILVMTVLMSIQQLLQEPNPDDALVASIGE